MTLASRLRCKSTARFWNHQGIGEKNCKKNLRWRILKGRDGRIEALEELEELETPEGLEGLDALEELERLEAMQLSTLARTRVYQDFCFLLSHLSQPSQQHNKTLTIKTIPTTSKWQTPHFSVTLLSHYYHIILSPPPLHPIEQNLLSHYYHIAITLLSPKPFPLKKSTPPNKIWLISSQNYHIPSKISHIFPKMSDISSKKSLVFRKKWDIIEENAHLRCSALWQKKTQNSWYIRAHARVKIKAIIYRPLLTSEALKVKTGAQMVLVRWSSVVIDLDINFNLHYVKVDKLASKIANRHKE